LEHLIHRSGRTVQNRPLWSVHWADIPGVVRLGQALSGDLAAGLATVAVDPRWCSTFRSSGWT
jgi:hypothetical protein